MRIRIALPILLASATFMMVGLGLASAQQQPEEPNQRPVVPPPGLAPQLKQLGKQRPTPPVRPGQPQPPQPAGDGQQGNLGQDGPSGDAVPQIRRFETGIDYEPTSPGSRVTFNLEDADLPDLVRLISSITGKRFILPGKARSIKATVYAPTKVSAAEAYQAFLSILEINGMTIVPSGRYLKIVETSGIENQPISTYTGASPTPGDDRFVTRMHQLSNVSAEDVATLLTRFKSAEGNVTAYAPTNTLIITDMGSNIRRMLRIIEAVDVARTGEQIWIEPVHYANATELAARLQEIFPVGQTTGGGGGGAATPTPPPSRPRANAARAGARAAGNAGPTTIGNRAGESRITKILADERTNSLIILATERAYLRILELIRQLDQALEGEGGIHVHYVQHGDSEDIASTLTSLISGAQSARAGAGRPAPAAQGAAGATTGSGFEGQIRVTSHEPSNALVITSSLHDYAALRRVIERLDAPRRQVFIEAVIMELSVNRSNSLGMRFHGGILDTPDDQWLSVLASNGGGVLSLDAESLQGLAVGVQAPRIPETQSLIGLSLPAFGVVLNALATSGDANVLSTPHIIAMDNVEAEISVGENVPLQTSGFGGLGGGLSGLAGLAGLAGQGQEGAAGLAGLAGLAGGGGFGAAPRQDVGTKIRLTPHINEADEVRLEIEEEISEAQASAEGTLGVKTISKRLAKTELVVRDGQTVVIGGLMRDAIITNESKIPILGDIPLLGVLFRQSSRETRKTNLMLFLTPYIIREPSDLRAIFERKMRERQEFIDRYFVFGDDSYEPPMDYSRTRGLVAEIANELDRVAAERQLLEEAQARPPPNHIPRSPVGAAPEHEGDGSGDVVISPDDDAGGEEHETFDTGTMDVPGQEQEESNE